MEQKLIYLDNAATTYPKPGKILDEMISLYARIGVSPGRGSYDRAIMAQEFIQDTRTKLARFFGAPDPDRIIFTANATDGLNLAIFGLLQPGDHVITTRLEHNSVLRPLYHLQQQKYIDLSLVPFDHLGFINPDDIAKAIRPETRLVIVNHASNVIGTVQPVEKIGTLCRDAGIAFLVDASQSSGQIAVDITAMKASAVAFTGHKSLYGPTGIGGLVLHPDLEIRTTRFGGTGIESKSLIHTQAFPHRLEAGTHNLIGIIGLSLGLDYILSNGLCTIHEQEMVLLKRLCNGLSEIPGIKLYCAENLTDHLAVLAVNINGILPEDTGAILDGDFNIAVRTGLHCAPLVHEDLGTGDSGAVRFSLGHYNTEAQIDRVVEAMSIISRHKS
jgi:cysteine desulfurase / selenocysteine lyase